MLSIFNIEVDFYEHIEFSQYYIDYRSQGVQSK